MGKTPFLSSFLYIFQKNRVASQQDSSNKHIPLRNKKFGQNRPKIKGQSHYAQKSVKIGKKKKVRFGKNSIYEPILKKNTSCFVEPQFE